MFVNKIGQPYRKEHLTLEIWEKGNTLAVVPNYQDLYPKLERKALYTTCSRDVEVNHVLWIATEQP